MRCIFCKISTLTEESVEHIIPESMGNTEHCLPVGAVCFSCNQYFGHKIERPILETTLLRHLRAGMIVSSKRGRIPRWKPSEGVQLPKSRLMGRFLGKVGLEVLAFKTQDVKNWNDEIVNKPELDLLRSHVRYNEGDDWPFIARTLHPVNAVFREGSEFYELLHEFDIFLTLKSEVYSVLSLFGVELTINLGCRSIDGYKEWLLSNHNTSPLYVGKNA